LEFYITLKIINENLNAGSHEMKNLIPYFTIEVISGEILKSKFFSIFAVLSFKKSKFFIKFFKYLITIDKCKKFK